MSAPPSPWAVALAELTGATAHHATRMDGPGPAAGAASTARGSSRVSTSAGGYGERGLVDHPDLVSVVSWPYAGDMSTQVNIAEAKARLSELVSRAVRGEEITLARSGTAMARIVALEEPPRRELGRHPELAVDRALLLAPMDEDELAEWE